MSIIDRIESLVETGYSHLRDLLTHDGILEHILSDVEAVGRLLERPEVQAIAESLYPAAIPAFQLINAAQKLDDAVKSGSVTAIAGAASAAITAADPIIPDGAQKTADAIKSAADEVGGITFPGEDN